MNEDTIENSDSSEETAAPQWLEPSQVGAEYMRHEAAMLRCEALPVLKAYPLPAGFNVGTLRRLAKCYLPKKIVIIEHDGIGFEVRRLEDRADIELFYELTKREKPKQLKIEKPKDQTEIVLKAIRDFFNNSIEDVVKYEGKALELRNSVCISLTYLQRRLVSVMAFRTDERGAVPALRATLSQMESNGLVRRLEESEVSELFGTSNTVYRVSESALE